MSRLLPHRERLGLRLAKLEKNQVTGIYGSSETWMPERARYLEPKAALSYVMYLHPAGIVVSDMFRGPDAQLAARKGRKGSKAVSYSGHGYGFSIDVSVSRVLSTLDWSKRQLDEFMASNGWYCHRRDHKRGHEDWHYNYFGMCFSAFVRPEDRRTSQGLERMIVNNYGVWFYLTHRDAQIALAELGFYSGEMDGVHGPITRQAASAFQRAWRLVPDGVVGKKTQRALGYLTSFHVYESI